MDLQTERRLEHFFRLLELPIVRIEPRMEIVDPPFRFYVEYVPERLLLSVALPMAGLWPTDNPLQKLLELCQPERAQGIPLRGYMVADRLIVSCSPAPESPVEKWVALYRLQQRLLWVSAGGEEGR